MISPRFFIGLALAGLVVGTTTAAQQPKAAPPASKSGAAAPKGPVIAFEFKDKGTVEIEMSPDDAPKSVAHVLDLVRNGFYRGQRIHWVQGAAVQFGDPYSKDMTKRDQWGSGGSGKSVGVAETSKHKFDRGSVGLYYQADFGPKSADSQMFILRGPNSALDGKYAMIGHVVNGMATVDKLEVTDRILNAYVKGENGK
jgi:cyclophilin family peptidyl-prolyl cis-trans isomerase